MFLNPWMLSGLVGISVPIIIHLLNRFRRRRIDWAAMELLRRAMVMRSRQIQMEDLLILALRCLAVALIVLALARPRTSISGSHWLGGGQQVAVVIALDASYSMAHNPGVSSRFDHARQNVRVIQKTLTEGDPVSLVLLGSRPRILLRNMAYNERRFDKALDEAKPLPERVNLELCLEQLSALIDESKGSVRECYLLTDAQALTWGNLSEKSRSLLNRISTHANLYLLPAARDASPNLTLTSLSFASGALRKGATARYLAEVRNNGPSSVEKVAVTLLQNDNPVDRRVIERIEPNQTASVPLFTRFERAGNIKLAAMLERDALLTDNMRYAVAPVRERVRVLCVDGAPSERPHEGETAYLRAAVTPARSAVAPSLVVDTVAWLQFAATRLADYEIVMLANVPDLRQEQVQALYNFTQQGGGLVVFLGDKISATLLNERMQTSSGFLLPAEIGDKVVAPKGEAEGWPIEAAAERHRLASVMRSLPAGLLSEVHLRQHFKLNPLPGAQTILQVGGTSAPLLVEKRIGLGRVLLFGSSANRAWTDFPIHPAFPILLHDMITYLSAGADEQSILVGQPMAVPLAQEERQASVVLRDPSGNEIPVQVTEREHRRVAEFAFAELPGFYEVRPTDLPGSGLVAVNVDPAEGDARALPESDLRTGLAGMRLRILPETENLASLIRENRIGREWWRVLMVFALAVLVAEVFLAYYFSRRMRVVARSTRGEHDGFLTVTSPKEGQAVAEPVSLK